jgi:hypothetical protein
MVFIVNNGEPLLYKQTAVYLASENTESYQHSAKMSTEPLARQV